MKLSKTLRRLKPSLFGMVVMAFCLLFGISRELSILIWIVAAIVCAEFSRFLFLYRGEGD